MSKKTLFSLIASILGVTGIAESSTSKLEVSIGGSPAEFPEGSKGFLIVDTAGDGFDFAKSPTILENKSESAVGSKWGDDDAVVMAGLPTVEFPAGAEVSMLHLGMWNPPVGKAATSWPWSGFRKAQAAGGNLILTTLRIKSRVSVARMPSKYRKTAPWTA